MGCFSYYNTIGSFALKPGKSQMKRCSILMILPLIQQSMEARPEFQHPSIRTAPRHLKAEHVLVTLLNQKSWWFKFEWNLRKVSGLETCPLLQEYTGREKVMLGSNIGVKSFGGVKTLSHSPYELIGLTTVAPADRFHVFQLFTFETLSLAGRLSMFRLQLCLCVWLMQSQMWNGTLQPFLSAAKWN